MEFTNELKEQLKNATTVEEAKAVIEKSRIELTDEQMSELVIRVMATNGQELSENELEVITGGRRYKHLIKKELTRYHNICGGTIKQTDDIFGYNKCEKCKKKWFWKNDMINDSHT